MMIGMGFFWLAIILGVVWLVRDGIERWQPEPPRENALTTLDRRFAEGAISLDEYKQRRDVLTGAAAPHVDQQRHTLLSGRSTDETPRIRSGGGGRHSVRTAPPRPKGSRDARALPPDDAHALRRRQRRLPAGTDPTVRVPDE